MKKIYLVDVSSMFFRAFYAIRSLSNPAGMPTNAIYGLLSMTIKLLREEKPDYMAFCFDLPEPSFRKELDPRYKANRSEMPEDLIPQIPYIKKLAVALGIPCFEKSGFEADDLIGTLTIWSRAQNLDVYIVSGDKDFSQLVEDHVWIYDTMKEIRYNPALVIEKWGVDPHKFNDYLAIVGDSSDNIPGVSGIGPKGAQKLLQEFDSLEDIYKNLDRIANKNIKTKLEANRDEAFLSQKLSKIVTDVPLDLSLESIQLKEFAKEDLRELLTELDFKSYLKSLVGTNESTKPIEQNIEVKNTENKKTEINNIENDNFETKDSPINQICEDLNPLTIQNLESQLKAENETWGFLNERGVYLSQKNENKYQVYQLQGSLEEFSLPLTKLNLKWKGYDLKHFFKSLRIQRPTVLWDHFLAAYVLKPKLVDSLSEILSQQNLILPELSSPQEELNVHLRLEHILRNKLNEWGGQKVLENLELKLLPILLDMEETGIKLDQELLKSESEKLAIEIKSLEKQIHDLAGTPFNVASPKQLGPILFDKLKLPVIKKTKTGYSTDNEVLEKLLRDPESAHPIIEPILEYRELTKLKSTYVDALPLLVDTNSRIHTTFNQSLTATGRLSSVNPNLQNIPIRTERGQIIRKAFIANQGKKLVSADYSQIELRILAHICGDEALIKAFEKDLDIHAATAAEIFQVELNLVTSEMRRKAKAVNFGLAYGQGPQGLSESLRITRKEASEIIEHYFQRFPKVKNYMQEIVEKAKSQLYVESIFGRRRYIDELKSTNAMIRKFGERAAINAPMQASVSDLVKKAMIDVYSDLEIQATGAKMLLQVHDELVFEVEEGKAQTLADLVKNKMEKVIKLIVPLRVDVGIGDNWSEL